MTRDELEGFFQSIQRSYPLLADLLVREPIFDRWVDRLKHFTMEDATYAFQEWVDSHNATPTLEDMIRLCEVHRDQQRKQQEKEQDEAALEALTEKAAQDAPPHLGALSDDADKAWVEFHLYWINKGLNGALAEISRNRRSQAKTTFPWGELIDAYKALAVSYPRLNHECVKALALYGETVSPSL